MADPAKYTLAELDGWTEMLLKEKSLKADSIKTHQQELKAIMEHFARPPPYSTAEIHQYMVYRWREGSGKTTADRIRRALTWEAETHNRTTPVCAQTHRLCTALQRVSPNLGAPPRIAIQPEQAEILMQLAASKSKTPGDVWDRNRMLIAVDIGLGFRIDDLIHLEFMNYILHKTPSVSVFGSKTGKPISSPLVNGPLSIWQFPTTLMMQ